LILNARLLSANIGAEQANISKKPRFERAAEMESPKPGFTRQEETGAIARDTRFRIWR
jgi:hypothetical protein